jgi:hypothetical protein
MPKGLYWTSTIIGALFLSMYCLELFVYIESNNPWGHKNFWGTDVGTYLLMAILLVRTPAFLFAVWKHYPKKRKSNCD